MTKSIDADQDVIDSRDVIERIDELTARRTELGDALHDATKAWNDENEDELNSLVRLANQAEHYASDWKCGEQLIRDSYFAEYIKGLIADCYELPKGFDGNAWPWRHMKLDYEAAATEAKDDYTPVEFSNVTYWIR